MSRRISQRYLLLFFSINAILICGSSRRISRRASCPSCSQDCPEALTVQLPWYSYRESNLQPRTHDSISLLKNSPYRSMQGEAFQDIIRDDYIPNKNSMSFGKYRSFSQQESANGNLRFSNFPNVFSGPLDRRKMSRQNKPVSEYPLAHAFPLRQSFDRSENLFFRSPRDKYSGSSSKNQNFQDYGINKEDVASKLFNIYRGDAKPWEDSNDMFSNNVRQELVSKIENSFPSRRESEFLGGRNLIKTTPNPVDQRYEFANPPEAYYTEEFSVPEIKRNHLSQNLNIQKATEDEKSLDKHSLQSWNLRQKQARNNFFEEYPARDEQMIITENDNEQTNYNSHSELIFPQDLNIWSKDGESFDNWDFLSRNSPQQTTEIKQLQEAENNWPQLHLPRNDIFITENERENKEYPDEEDINQDYFDDVLDKNTIKTGRNNDNSSQNTDTWRATQDEELSEDFTSKNEYEIRKEKQLEIYSQDNKHFQDEKNEDVLFKHGTHTEIIRDDVNPYEALLSRYLSTFNNNEKNSGQSLESQGSTKYSTLHKNFAEERNARFFDNKAVIHDLILPKNIFNAEEYNNPVAWQNTKDNVWNKAISNNFDPDLLDDVENPPTEPIESTSTKSRVESSTPR